MSLPVSEIAIVNLEAVDNYIYVEKCGPFMETAGALWGGFYQAMGTLNMDKTNIKFTAGLNCIDESKAGDEKYTLQAGRAVVEVPKNLPSDFKVKTIAAGKFAKFTLTGSYSYLAEVYPHAFKIISENNLERRLEFSIEKYVSTYGETPEDQLITEIYIPIN